MKTRKIFTLIIFYCLFLSIYAEEGMWIPVLLEKYAIKNMNEKGLQLSAQDIYNINEASLKDAIVIFGTGCTGEVISEEGLVLTNHHCGFQYIQSHSSIEKNYISTGFWAMSKQEELPNPNLSVTFLIRMENVSEEILKGTESAITEQQRDVIIDENIERLKIESVKNSGYKSIIKQFYYGLEYYMFIYQEFKDVRLVGAPNYSIGNFGIDSDNWIWPRHTGDFSIFRIYADKDNNPTTYSPDNIPYKPRKFLSVSLNGYKENDFTMVMGYPGITNEYLISDGVKVFTEMTYPQKVKLRDMRMSIISKYMNQDSEIHIQYASKYHNISKFWKKWQGVVNGIEKYNAIEKKEIQEKEFDKWVQKSKANQSKYGNVLADLKDLYSQLSVYALAYEYSNENILATEIIDFASKTRSFLRINKNLSDNEKIKAKDKFTQDIKVFFRDYNESVDLEIFQYMLRSYYTDINPAFHPDFFKTVQKKYKGDFGRFATVVMNKTFLTSKIRILEIFRSYPENESQILSLLLNDPVYRVLNSYSAVYNDAITARYKFLANEINTLYRLYLQGLHAMDPSRVLYPDANFTMRISYGKIEGYQPADGVRNGYYTTIDGIIEKNAINEVYAIPSKLYQLYIKKDFGPWINAEGKLPVCFVASNHTSGGNSGSPILDAKGHLIGLNFDRNWEGTMSDIWYDPLICRNISVDIRYILFIIDKYADASYLIDEMDLIWE